MAHGERHTTHHRLELMSSIMSGQAARSLELLRAIDGTIEAMVYIRRDMEALSESCESLLSRANTEDLEGEPLESEVVPSLEKVQDYLKDSHIVLCERLDAALHAPELEADDGIVEAYERTIGSVEELNTKVEQLRWVVLERGADYEVAHKPVVMHNASDIDSFLDDL